MSKSDLSENKLKVNRILEKYGFDKLRTGTDDMIDNTPYDLTDSFDGLEITEYDKEINANKKLSKTKSWSLDGIIADATAEDLYNYLDGKDITKKKESKEMKFHPQIIPTGEIIYDNESEENFMTNNYKPYPMQQDNTSSNNYCSYPVQQASTPAVSTANNEIQPIQNNAVTYPTMTLNFAPKINLSIPPETTNEEVKSRLNALTPKISSADCMKTAVTMASALHERNINMNIDVRVFPEITIKFGDDSDGYSEGKIIDI